MLLFFWKNDDFSTHFLPLLTMNPPRLIKSDCNLAPMSLLTRSGSTVVDHTHSLCVININAPMQAKFRRAILLNLSPEIWFI